MTLVHGDLTEKIIGAAIEVHRRLGPGFLESIYERALIIELRKRGLRVESQMDTAIYYDGIEVGKHRLDLLVENLIVVELKAVKALDDGHLAVTKSYLSATGLEHGLLLNFARVVLEVNRVIHTR
jgi:GxxExxY protein